MFKTTLSAVRRATLVGVGAVSLALGASMLSAPAASAYVQAFVPVIPPATSSDAGISAPAVHDSNSVPLEHEHVVNWSDYEVTGDHEITFSVPTGTATCFDVRAEAAESNGTLHVATVEGSVLGAPDKCSMEGRVFHTYSLRGIMTGVPHLYGVGYPDLYSIFTNKLSARLCMLLILLRH